MFAMFVFVVLVMLRILVFKPEDSTSAASREVAIVRRVIDGDTIDLTDDRRVRQFVRGEAGERLDELTRQRQSLTS